MIIEKYKLIISTKSLIEFGQTNFATKLYDWTDEIIEMQIMVNKNTSIQAMAILIRYKLNFFFRSILDTSFIIEKGITFRVFGLKAGKNFSSSVGLILKIL